MVLGATGNGRRAEGARLRDVGEKRPWLQRRPFAFSAVTGGWASGIAGAALGFAWMGLFPQPPWRTLEGSVIGGIIVGLWFGPIIGMVFGTRGWSRKQRLVAAAITFVTWTGLAQLTVLLSVITRLHPRWLPIVAMIASVSVLMAAAGELAGLVTRFMFRQRTDTVAVGLTRADSDERS